MSYKVLWVEDDKRVVEERLTQAEDKDIDLIWKTNWQEAKKVMEEEFEDFSAIILDAHCKLSPDEGAEPFFLAVVIVEIERMYAKHICAIPWYVYSAGTADGFEVTRKMVEKMHGGHKGWGECIYLKDRYVDNKESFGRLLDRIVEVAEHQPYNTIKARHADAFRYMEEGKLMTKWARKTMLRWLSAIYFPQKNPGFGYLPNELRQCVEDLFDGLYCKGLLSNKWPIRFKEGIKFDCFVYGMKKQPAFPDLLCDEILSIYHIVTNGSHSNIGKKPSIYHNIYLMENKEMLSGCALQLCHVVRFMGHYAEECMNKKIIEPVNKEELNEEDGMKIRYTDPTKEEIEGSCQWAIPEEMGVGAGPCILRGAKSTEYPAGTRVRILKVEDNKDARLTKKKGGHIRYIYIATEYEKVEEEE